jgi:hypothetical protein
VIQLSTLAGDAIQVLTRETLFRKDAIKVRDNYRKLKSLASGHDHSRHFDSTITPWLTLHVPNWESLTGEQFFDALIDTLPGEREQELTLRERVLRIPPAQFEVDFWNTFCWQALFWSISDILTTAAVNTPEAHAELCSELTQRLIQGTGQDSARRKLGAVISPRGKVFRDTTLD